MQEIFNSDSKKRNRKILYFILFLLLFTDTSYSFFQHYAQPLDGDLAWNIVPSQDVSPILESPFGTDVFFSQQPYSNPNRFFCHWGIKKYFENVPIILQVAVTPIESVYLSAAILKILVQILLIALLSIAISGTKNIFKLDFIISAVLIAPLFQTNGYKHYMGIIDSTPTYTFFYALPILVIVIYFLPLIFRLYHNNPSKPNFIKILIWIVLSVIASLSGPLNTGIALICSVLLFINFFLSKRNKEESGLVKNNNKKLPFEFFAYLIPISIFSVYSLFIGQYNLNNTHASLTELYSKLPIGIYLQFTQKLGFPILFLILFINVLIIRKHYNNESGRKILSTFKWIGIFALVYILLLPVGGYRDYRPNVVRYDTILPITLCLIFMFGASTLHIFRNISKNKPYYFFLIALVLLIYTTADKPEVQNNKCEKAALAQISRSIGDTIILNNDCSVLTWNKNIKPEDSELNSDLLLLWGITKTRKIYYTK